jgi:hypothetical protein
LLAMVVNDGAGYLKQLGAFQLFASKLAPTETAEYLRTNTRPLENWEQGRATPNAQAATLIRLVAKFPETVERLALLT